MRATTARQTPDALPLTDSEHMPPSDAVDSDTITSLHRAMKTLSPVQRAALCSSFGISDSAEKSDGAAIVVHPGALDDILADSLRALRRKPVA